MRRANVHARTRKAASETATRAARAIREARTSARGRDGPRRAPCLDLAADGVRVGGEEAAVPALVQGEQGHVVDGGLVARLGDEVVEGGGQVRVGQGGRALAQREAIGGGQRQLDVAAREAGGAAGEGREVGDGEGQL